MSFKVRIKNIGKLTDAEISIGDFTVFAGPNNTGKSFVSKLLYSLFNALSEEDASLHINNLTRPFRQDLNKLVEAIDDVNSSSSLSEDIKALEQGVEELETMTRYGWGDIEEVDKIIPSLSDMVKNVQKKLPDICSSLISSESRQLSLLSAFSLNTLESIEKSLTELQKSISGQSGKAFIAFFTKNIIKKNLIQNFQVESPSELMGQEDVPSEIEIESFGKFRFSNEKTSFDMEFPDVMPALYPLYSHVIYLESPVYWQLKNALENLRMDSRYSLNRREKLSGIPGYFYDLASTIKYKYTEDIAFPDVYKRLIDVIGGEIAISDSGDLSFRENGRNFSLSVTAMGATNLGILALLVERKVLDKGTFLFIDEPEAHLHPTWQVVMAEALFELAKGGVNVFVATHSIDILKWLEVHVKKNPEDERLVALNQFPVKNSEIEEDFETKIASIKDELTKPFSDLYLEGL